MQRKHTVRPSLAILAILVAVFFLTPPLGFAQLEKLAHASQVTHPGAVLALEARLTATEDELSQGYFVFDTGKRSITLVVWPGSDLHKFFGAKVGRKVRLVISSEEEIQ